MKLAKDWSLSFSALRTKSLFFWRFCNPSFCRTQAGRRAPFSYNFSCWSVEKQLQECTWDCSNFSPLAKKCFSWERFFLYFHPGIFKPTGLLVWVLICKDLRIVCFKLPWIWFICSELKTWKVFCFYEEHTHVFTHSLWATLIFSHSSVSLRILPASARAEMVTKATRKTFNILTTFDQDLWGKTNSQQLPSSCWPNAGGAVQ